MSTMPPAYPIAIAISDLHLSLTAPACRADKDWLKTQAWTLEQVKDLAASLQQGSRNVPLPVLCAGDVFDRWNPPAELITFALRCLPIGMFCVPGQHDLPNHRIEDVHRSGYGVLSETEHIKDLCSAPYLTEWDMTLRGFGWGQKIKPPATHSSNFPIKIAVIHRYVWADDAKYPDAPEDANIHHLPGIADYDVVITGDNHKSFSARKGRCNVFNPGTFIRRKSDEIDHEPCVGVIYSDGTVKRKKLDTSLDKFHSDAEHREEVALDMKRFIDGLEKLGEHGLDFREAVKNHLRKDDVKPETRKMILQALEAT
jgi:DNA repair exonuclease SbcCD nuclease subunit